VQSTGTLWYNGAMIVIQKNVWAEAVLERIRSTEEGAQHLKDAVQITESESEQAAPKDAWELLAWLRGDEPADAYEAGDPAHDYADFLTTEWDMYGPEGE